MSLNSTILFGSDTLFLGKTQFDVIEVKFDLSKGQSQEK